MNEDLLTQISFANKLNYKKIEHGDLITFGQDILLQFGYKNKDLLFPDNSLKEYKENGKPRPDIVTRDKKIALEAGSINHNLEKISELLKDYDNLLWIPYPKIFNVSVPVFRMILITKTSPNKEVIEKLTEEINRLKEETKRLKSNRFELKKEIAKGMIEEIGSNVTRKFKIDWGEKR